MDIVPRRRKLPMPQFWATRRHGLLAKFALASVLPIVLLGAILQQYLEHQIRARTLGEARRGATLVAQLGIQPQLSPLALKRGLSVPDLISLDRALAAGRAQATEVRIWNRRGEIVYSDDRSLIGNVFTKSDELRAALNGHVATEVASAGDRVGVDVHPQGKQLEVYVPLVFPLDRAPAGALEIYLPYSPLARAIRHDSRTLFLLLLSGLGLLYAVLFRIVAGASRRLRHQAEVNQHQALHDSLTGLANRALFRDRAQQAILAANREGIQVAILLMDLDRFKDINDTLGHHSGDLLLQEVAHRLTGTLREGDTVARLGGDEFAVVLPRVLEASAAVEAARRIRKAVEEPLVLQNLVVRVEPSIGIAVYPEHGDDVDLLIQHADVAMYVAKAANSGHELYDADVDEHNPYRLTLVGELRHAIDENQLVLHYQPKAELATGEIKGVEALVRWKHPTRGLLQAGDFISVAQRTGLIKPLTLWVLDSALSQCRRWHDEGFELSVAVNLSARNLLDLQLPQDIASLLDKWNVAPGWLELEITESTIMADPVRAIEVLTRLSDMGVGFSVDDFGTGYSSLAYLKRLPVSELKIDRSFVMNMSKDDNDAIIVRSTIDLGRNLGLRVVAEGVETEDVWHSLQGLGCDTAQGYYLSRPVSPEELTPWLRSTAVRVHRQPVLGEAV
jgi:diguanylate cyclase (GGDEF)-like protein